MEGNHRYGTFQAAAHSIQHHLRLRAELLSDLDSAAAIELLRRNRRDSLVVIPSTMDNSPFTVIEVSRIRGLNMICSRAGGIPEIVGDLESEQLFEPNRRSTAQAIEEWLTRGPRAPDELFSYDCESANEKWIRFHQEISQSPRSPVSPGGDTGLVACSADHVEGVDICIPYFNSGPHLPDLLEALSTQTFDNFKVFVVDDGSTDAFSQVTFERMKARYQSRGWVFTSTANNGPNAARNHAASLGESGYICFVGTDHVCPPTMLRSLVDSITTSGDDCLTCYLYGLEDTVSLCLNPHDPKQLLKPPSYVYLPIGNCPEAGMLAQSFGEINMIVRREVFVALGGFSAEFDGQAGQNDYAFLAEVFFGGYRSDVVPEFLFYHREHPESRRRKTDMSDVHVLHTYENRLSQLGLRRLPSIVRGLKHKCHLLEQELSGIEFLEPADVRSVDFLAREVHWGILIRALSAKMRRQYQLWRKRQRDVHSKRLTD